MKCIICRADTDIVCSSVCCGPVSHAYCKECLEAGREDWATLIGRVMGLDKGHVAEWLEPIIETTCAYYKKTEDEFWAEVKKISEEYDEMCAARMRKRMLSGASEEVEDEEV